MFIQAPKDLTKIKSKLLFGLTRRQLICFGAGALVGVPVYFLTKGAMGNSTAVLLMIFVMLPMFLLAMYEKDGMSAEILLRNFIRSVFAWPSKRHYRTENLYGYLKKEGEAYRREEKEAETGLGGAGEEDAKPVRGSTRAGRVE